MSAARATTLTFAALSLCGVLAGGAIQVSAGELGRTRDDAPGDSSPFLSRAGYLQVVVDPWADVLVDGETVLTTPSARSLPLSPGKHYVKLVNPFFQDQAREVVIHSGKTFVLDAKLKPKSTSIASSGGARR